MSKAHRLQLRRGAGCSSTGQFNEAIAEATSLAGDGDNSEYMRGMCELLARMFPTYGVCTEERSEEINAIVREAYYE